VSFSLLIIAGCSGKKPGTAAVSDASKPLEVKGSIEVWYSADDFVPLFYEVKATVEKNFPGTQVRIESIPYAELHTRQMTACQSNAGPDVMHQSVTITNGFMKQGLLEPIQDYMKRAGRDLLNEFNPEFFAIVREGDVFYALPTNTSVMALVYNNDLFKEAGLTRAPETWAEVYEWAEKLTKRNPDGSIKVYGIAWPGNAAGNIWFRLVPNIWSAGGDVCDPEMKTATMNTQAVKEAVAYYTGVLAKGIAPRSMMELNQSGIQPLFLNGNVAMTIENMTYPKQEIVDKNVFDLGVALWPGKNGPLDAGIGGWYACIPASAKNKEGGAYFIDHLTTAERQKIVPPLPGLKAALDDPQWASPFYEPFKEALRSKSRMFPQFENAPMAQSIMLNLVQSVLAGTSSIDDAVKLANDEIQELLDIQNGKS
jgi:multiple sugar transport system substrate-binding protein